jgi:glycosyltransferase involved in cell wall biosynthesis
LTKILYLTDGLDFGGAERQLSLLLKYLRPEWETRVVSLRDGPFHQILQDQKTKFVIYQRHSRFDLVPVFQLYLDILQYKPDIIHSWGWLSSALVAPICKLLHICFIDGSIRIAGKLQNHYWRTKITFFLADLIVANSLAGISSYQVPAEKSCVVYNGLDPDRFKYLNHNSKTHHEITTVIMTGRISPYKDFPSFFEAARRLNFQEPGFWKFIAIGAGFGDSRSGFIKLAEDLVDAGVVELPIAGLEVLPYLQKADIGVLLSTASFKEGISNSIMEYMACGLPVICSDSGGNRELVLDGDTGYIIPSENVEAFIEKLLYLKNHPDISKMMGNAGFRRVNSLCSMERMISNYEDIYSIIIAKKTIIEKLSSKKVNHRGFS